MAVPERKQNPLHRTSVLVIDREYVIRQLGADSAAQMPDLVRKVKTDPGFLSITVDGAKLRQLLRATR
jgi:hypothetical protein